jgi:hypothetical protein
MRGDRRGGQEGQGGRHDFYEYSLADAFDRATLLAMTARQKKD